MRDSGFGTRESGYEIQDLASRFSYLWIPYRVSRIPYLASGFTG